MRNPLLTDGATHFGEEDLQVPGIGQGCTGLSVSCTEKVSDIVV